MKHFGLDVARAALARWGDDPATLSHLQTSGNAVYRFLRGGTPWILRLTDVAYRTPAHNEAEMAFLEHLDRSGVRVSAPHRSRSEALVEVVDGCSASVLSWAPGVLVEPGVAPWGEPLLREWGRALGAIHAAAERFEGPSRWAWWEEDLLVDHDRLLPRDDAAPREEFARVMEALHALPKPPGSYGLTHADLGAQNFRYDPAVGITCFDFGNACHHWYAMDLAISLSTLRRQPDRDRLRAALLAGYVERFPLDPTFGSRLPLFLRLRVLYVYLSRLQGFGPAPSEAQREVLMGLRGLVVNGVGWA